MLFHRSFLSVGSNLEPREKNILDALGLFEDAENRIVAVSSLFETEPEDVADQPDFYNIAIAVDTCLDPWLLLRRCVSVENRMGRVRAVRGGPRNIDIDILFFDSLVIETPSLTIPHPRMHRRRFVLVPMAEIFPGERHPVLDRSISRLLACCPGGRGVRRVGAVRGYGGFDFGASQVGCQNHPGTL
jgi:2-amino-4-hydroxy-6-hydroxymethyldihydropteridine diphosphokinase